MSQKANPTTIGLFVVSGLALLIGGVLLFSSAKLFSPTQTYIAYFDSSLNGLSEGAPVKLRGVQIGIVREIFIHHNQADTDRSMPVLIELQERLLKSKSDMAVDLASKARITELVGRGLRASLEIESFVTGVLYVDLSFDPFAEPPVFHQREPRYLEIPTKRTEIQQLTRNLAELDLKGFTKKLESVLDKLDTRLGELALGQIVMQLTNLLASMDRVVTSPDLTNSLAALHQTLDRASRLSLKLEAKVDPLSEKASATLAELRLTLQEVRGGMEGLRDVLAPQHPLQQQLDQTLESLTEAARSVADLADFLSRNPNALLSGRQHPALKR